jgi:hypothetical protein
VDWRDVRFRQDCRWSPRQLVIAALLWAWSDESTLKERFGTARKITSHLEDPQQEFAESCQAFAKMLRRWTMALAAILQATFRHLMEERLAEDWSQHGFVIFGVDGSRISLPRTKSNELVYGPSKQKGKKKKHRSKADAKKAATPLLWLTMMWHAGTGLIWDWRIGPTDSSERDHFREMLPQLPANALIAADAGYVGYDYLEAVRASGRHFLLRVGSNVRLLRCKGIDVVYLWPQDKQRQQQPPLALRLLVVTNGSHPVYLVTNVLSHSRLSDRQLIDIYRRRWGIELFFRHLKQTFRCRKMRSHCAENARYELEWSLLGFWAMTLFAQIELTRQDIDRKKMSFAGVLRAFRRLLRDYRHPWEREQSLRRALRHALRDQYKRRNKTSRDYPRQKRRTPIGPPKILELNAIQIRLANELLKRYKKGLTA